MTLPAALRADSMALTRMVIRARAVAPLVAAALFGSSALAQPPRAGAPAPATDVDAREIVAGEAAWGQAYVSGDVAVVNRLLADDFLGVDPYGRTYDKQTVLKEVGEGRHSTSDALSPVRVRIWGDAAVAQGVEHEVGPPPGDRRVDHVFTDTWVKRGGAWRVVAAEDLDLAPQERGP